MHKYKKILHLYAFMHRIEEHSDSTYLARKAFMHFNLSIKGAMGLICATIFLTACGSAAKKENTNPNLLMSTIKRVQILPFDGVAGADTAAEMISKALVNLDLFVVYINRIQDESIDFKDRLPSELLSEETSIGKKEIFYPDAILRGRVTRFSQGIPSVTLAPTTEILISLRLLSPTSGRTIWSQQYAKKSSTDIGLIAPTVDELMIELADEIANDFANLK